jgi:hypothetical protein
VRDPHRFVRPVDEEPEVVLSALADGQFDTTAQFLWQLADDAGAREELVEQRLEPLDAGR